MHSSWLHEQRIYPLTTFVRFLKNFFLNRVDVQFFNKVGFAFFFLAETDFRKPILKGNYVG